MNIIYMHTHDSGRYTSPYGYNLPTPNIMKLAEDGVLFRSAYSAAPTCSPSRAALLCGMYAHTAGMLGLAHRGFSCYDYSRHMASYFTKNGFETALSGIQHEANDTSRLGYEKILTRPRRGLTSSEWDFANADAAVAFIEQPHDKPFFLSFGMFNTHREYPENDRFNPDYVIPPHPVADTPENRADWCCYMKSVAVADECVGRVVAAVDRAGLREDTLIIYTTDHGPAFPGMKCSLYDTGIGVSLIMSGAGLPRGVCRSELISQVDIYPTLCRLAGIDIPDWCVGVDARPLIFDGKPIRGEVFAEVTYHAAYQPMRAIRTKKYKYIRAFYDTEIQCYPNIDDSTPKNYLVNSPEFHWPMSPRMLFDVECDPVERVNLARDPAYSVILAELSAKLDCYMRETNDPLYVSRSVPLPSGAFANRMDGISPNEKDYIFG